MSTFISHFIYMWLLLFFSKSRLRVFNFVYLFKESALVSLILLFYYSLVYFHSYLFISFLLLVLDLVPSSSPSLKYKIKLLFNFSSIGVHSHSFSPEHCLSLFCWQFLELLGCVDSCLLSVLGAACLLFIQISFLPHIFKYSSNILFGIPHLSGSVHFSSTLFLSAPDSIISTVLSFFHLLKFAVECL